MGCSPWPVSCRNARGSRGQLRCVVGGGGDALGFGFFGSDAMVKRIVAGPGETISCCDRHGRLLRDGVPLAEPYLNTDFPFQEGSLDCATLPASSRCLPGLTVPEGHYVMLGDNRAHSSDSLSRCRSVPVEDGLACARFVPRDNIVGKVFVVVLPWSRLGTFI